MAFFGNDDEQRLIQSGIQMRNEMTAAGFPVPPGAQRFNDIQKYYMQFSEHKAKLEFEQQQNSQLAQQQGQGLTQASGLGSPNLQPLMEQLLASGGVKPANETMYRTGQALLQPNASPITRAEYGQTLTAQDKTVKETMPAPTFERGLDEKAKELVDQGKLKTENVWKWKQGQRIELAGAKAGAVIRRGGEAKLDLPVTPEDRLVNPDTLEPIAPGTTYRQANEQRAINVTPKMREELTGLDQVVSLTGLLKGMADNVITATSGPEAILQGAKLHSQSLLRDTAAKTYADSRQAFLGVLSRYLGGERGVLTDRDIYRIDRMLPAFSDTVAIKDFKIGMIDVLLQTAMDAKKRAITGKPPDKKIKDNISKLLDLLEKGQPKQSNKKGPTEMSDEELLQELNK